MGQKRAFNVGAWAWGTLAVAACVVAGVLFYVSTLPKHRFDKAMHLMTLVDTGMTIEQVKSVLGKADTVEYHQDRYGIEATCGYKASNGTVFVHFVMDRVDEVRVSVP